MDPHNNRFVDGLLYIGLNLYFPSPPFVTHERVESHQSTGKLQRERLNVFLNPLLLYCCCYRYRFMKWVASMIIFSAGLVPSGHY